MNEKSFENELSELISISTELKESDEFEFITFPEVDRVRSFDDVGMLTRNKGLVIRLKDGSEFQITIVKSRDADIQNEDSEDEDE